MDIVVTTDLSHAARELGFPVEQVQRTVELLDEGNTVPFITRFRKDQTGGFDEEQVRRIQAVVSKARMLAERKQTILKSIQSQGKLDQELANQINAAQSTKRLEDLYLPYKPKKQTLATTARQRGLQPLADEVRGGSPLAADLDLRAGDYLNPDVGLYTRADVLLGVGHLLAEAFSEQAVLRSKLRKILRSTGKLVTQRATAAEESREPNAPRGEKKPAQAAPPKEAQTTPDANAQAAPDKQAPTPPTAEGQDASPAATDVSTGVPAAEAEKSGEASQGDSQVPAPPAESPAASAPSDAAAPQEAAGETAEAVGETPAAADSQPAAPETAAPTPPDAAAGPSEGDAVGPPAHGPSPDEQAAAGQPAQQPDAAAEAAAQTDQKVDAVAQAVAAPAPPAPASQPKKEKKSKKEKEREKREKAFKDYFDFREDLSRLLPHRILAINRGERAKVLRVRLECDTEQMAREAEQFLVTDDHPHADFLRGVIRDCLARLVLPSLEREVRRELTERAETHAVEVFARNLRHLLLAPPLHGRRVLAIDPGFRSGCKMAALDEFGNVLGHGVIHLVGREERRRKARYRLAEIIRLHRLSVVAVGNGTACREVEQLLADVIAEELKDLDVRYCIVNEAGASVYSTSGIGREEFPDYDATLRSAISIGRRLLDPLSELVKINPSNIGVGLYQHDVKAKHLRESLDAVVESCVNYVGVDVNTASPALLRYVSGLNQLTARRLYDYRLQNGPFKNRDDLKDVPGFGAATFVQAAGFLKIRSGDNPLDATWIHPESYDVACRVLERLNSSVSDIRLAAEEGPEVPPPATPAAAAAQQPPEAAKAEAPAAAGVVVAPAGELPSPPGIPDEAPGDAPAPSPAEDAMSGEPPEAPPGPAETPPEEEAAPADGEVPADLKVTPEEAAPTEQPTPDADRPAEQSTSQPPAEPSEVPPTKKEEAGEAAAGEIPATTPAAAQLPALQPPCHADLAKRAAEVDVDQLAVELGIGKHLLHDILAALARPVRDPREGLARPIFRRGIVKIDDLKAEMELAGTVLNVVDFGVFVDIGLNDSALIHVSRLADRYVRDPHDVVSVGDVIKVWVVDVDKKRRRVSLTAIAPGTQRSAAQRRGKREKYKKTEKRPPRERAAAKRAASGPRPSGAGGRSRPDKKRSKPRHEYKRRAKPKPVVPITDAMKDGREPMRTFSDLQQFWKIQEEQEKDPEDKDGGEKTPPEKADDAESDAS